MKIDRLHISDFRGIEELTLEFEGKSAILFGINGAGKSSVLWAIENQSAFDSLFEWFFDQEFYENLKQKDDPGY